MARSMPGTIVSNERSGRTDVDADRARLGARERVQYFGEVAMPQRNRLRECRVRILVDPHEDDVVGERPRVHGAKQAHLLVEREALGLGERRFARIGK